MDLDLVAERHRLRPGAAERLRRLLDALAAEPDPHTSVARDLWVEVHVADSLVALELLAGSERIADLGAGAGFPGLPLAIALPHARVDLIESSSRKARLIERLAAAADVGNAHAVAERAEAWAAGDGSEAYEAVTARAVAPLAVLVEYAAPLLRDGGLLVAWKGARDEVEERAGAAAAEVAGLDPLEVRLVTPYPGSRDRHLHLYRKSRPTPDRFPRRPGMAAKRPLG